MDYLDRYQAEQVDGNSPHAPRADKTKGAKI
jgi:hypothetical protein